MNLTKLICDRVTYKGKGEQGFFAIWDSALPGFGLRITPQNAKSFIITYRIGGRKKMLTLGKYGVLTVEQARTMAREKLVDVTKGGDPAEERKKQRQSVERMEALCLEYLEKRSILFKKSWKEDQRRIQTRIIPALGNKSILDISRADVQRFHSRLGEERGHIESNRILMLLSAIYEFARKREIIPVSHPNPCRMIEKFREESRDVFVKIENLPRLVESIQQEPNQYVRAALMLILLTGARKTELLTAQWAWLDFDRGEIRLPTTKNGKPFSIRLNKPAIEILRALPQMEGNPFVFPSLTREGGRLWEINRPWRKIRARAGMEHLHIHDLRRSVGSWLAESGESLQLIGKVLNHRDTDTTSIYARLQEDPAKAAMDRIGEKVISILDVKKVSERKETA